MEPADRPERGGPRLRIVGGIVVALLMAAILATYVIVSRPWDMHRHRPIVHRSGTASTRGAPAPRDQTAPPGEEGGAGWGGVRVDLQRLRWRASRQ